MSIELAHFVSTAIGMENEDLCNLSTWVRAEQGAGTTLLMKHIPTSQKLKIQLPRRLKAKGRVTEDPPDLKLQHKPG